MDMDTTVNGLAHELWAIAQGRAPVEDVVELMMMELHAFAQAAITAEREACAAILGLSRSDTSLMAGEMTSQEWRTLSAVLVALQARMRRGPGKPC